ncbi:MAG TPA: GTP-binding protein [Nevskiaceae bacterium]|nr:GTP-binding protein [Nevskiaceae bacterium]
MAAPAVPIILLTGFLGAGKTTLLNRLLRLPALTGTAVVINELGSVGLDQHLAEAAREAPVLLEGGCVCCSARDGLAETVLDLLARAGRGELPALTRIVIETTGLANPGPVIGALVHAPALRGRAALSLVLTVVDGQHGLSTLERHPEALRQAAAADRLLLSKTDLAEAPALAALAARLAALNPGTEQLALDPGGDLATQVESLLAAPATGGRWLTPLFLPVAAEGAHGGGVESVVLRFDTPIRLAALGLWLELLQSIFGEDLLRLKGLVQTREHAFPVVVHAVQGMLYPYQALREWPDPARDSRLVLIGTGFSERALEALRQQWARLAAA